MGLDMYLTKRTRVKNYDFDEDNQFKVVVTNNGEPIKHIDQSKISSVEEDVMYWRKANHIHNWFVENCQDGKDDCSEYFIDKEQVQCLIDDCDTVLNDRSRASELLPTRSGFFFGSIDYDEWYFESIKTTRDSLKALVKENKGDYFPFSLYYSSSW